MHTIDKVVLCARTTLKVKPNVLSLNMETYHMIDLQLSSCLLSLSKVVHLSD